MRFVADAVPLLVDYVPPPPNEDSIKWRMTHGWPFRYFGMHSQAESVLGGSIAPVRCFKLADRLLRGQILTTRSTLELEQ